MRAFQRIAVFGLVGVGLLAALPVGCGTDGPDPVSAGDIDADGTNGMPVAHDWRFRHWPRPSFDAGVTHVADATALPTPPNPSQPSQPGVPAPAEGAAAGCAICARANDCCMVVSGGPLCTFSVDTCLGMSGPGQTSYIQTCKSLILTTIDAWTSGQRTPPAVCTAE